MPITFVNYGTKGSAASGNITPGLPGDIIANDLLVVVAHTSDQNAMSMDAAWTQIAQGNGGGTTSRLAAWYKFYDGSTDTTRLITHSGGQSPIACIMAFRGVDLTTPIDVTGTIAGGTDGSMECNGVTVATDYSWVLAVHGSADDNERSFLTDWFVLFNDDSAPAGYNKSFFTAAGTPDGSIGCFSRTMGAGATGTITVTQSASDPWATLLFALRPAASSSPIVQVVPFNNTTSTNIDVTFHKPPAAGNSIIALLNLFRSSSPAWSGVTDSEGNSYSANASVASGSIRSAIYSAHNISVSGAFSINLDPTSTSNELDGVILEVAGLDTSPFDKAGTSTGTTTGDNSVTASGANVQDNMLVVAVASLDSTDAQVNWGTPSGYTPAANQPDATNFTAFHGCFKVVSAGETSSATWTHDNASQTTRAATIATYKLAATGPGEFDLAATDPVDTAAFAATAVGTFALAATDPNDTAAFAMLQATMAMAATDPNDTAAMVMAVVPVGLVLDATDPNDTAAFAAAVVSPALTLAGNDPVDIADFALAIVPVGMALSSTDPSDTADFDLAEDGTDLDLATTDPADVGAFAMSVVAVGLVLGATDPNDTAAFAANVISDDFILASIDPNDTAAFGLNVVAVGLALGSTDPNDTAEFDANIFTTGLALLAADPNDTAEFDLGLTPSDDFTFDTTDPVDLADFAMEIATTPMVLGATDPRDLGSITLHGPPVAQPGGGTARQKQHSYSGLFADFSAPKKGEPEPLPEAEPEPNPDAEPPPLLEADPAPVPEQVIPQDQVGLSAIARSVDPAREAWENIDRTPVVLSPLPEQQVLPADQVGLNTVARQQQADREVRELQESTAKAVLAKFVEKRRADIKDHNHRARLLFLRRW